MKFQTLTALILLVSTSAFAASSDDLNLIDSHLRNAQGYPAKHGHIQNLPSGLTPGFYAQNVDHFGQAGSQTFSQRYWVDSEYATAGLNSPVIYHICGEGDVDTAYFLKDNAIAWAKSLGAHLVYLEHRYYGKSLPFADLANDHLQFLTLGNELEDLATFQKWMMNKQGLTGKWISVGGSYSGTISALYRQAHPELIVGALASSAPMIAGLGNSDDDQSEVSELSSIDPANDMRSWTYQSCTTFGFWMAQGMTTFEPSAKLCQQVFGTKVPLVDKTVYNQLYNAPFLANSAAAPSNILFTYGSADVWTKLGLSLQTNLNSHIKIEVIKGAEHHFDLNYPSLTDSAAVKAARADFLTQAKLWLQ